MVSELVAVDAGLGAHMLALVPRPERVLRRRSSMASIWPLPCAADLAKEEPRARGSPWRSVRPCFKGERWRRWRLPCRGGGRRH